MDRANVRPMRRAKRRGKTQMTRILAEKKHDSGTVFICANLRNLRFQPIGHERMKGDATGRIDPAIVAER
jgi:hypothetical protein